MSAAPPNPQSKAPPPSQPGTPSAPMSDEKERLKDLYKRADDLETKLNTASENGLFAHQKEVTHEEILQELMVALKISIQDKITPDDYVKAIEALDRAQNKFDTAIEKVGRGKRLLYVYGVPSAVYMFGILGVIGWVVLSPPSIFSGLPSFLTIPKKVMLGGTVGSVLQGITKLWNDVDERSYRKLWGTWYLLAPFMGALLGSIVYLVFYVGLVSSTQEPNLTNPSLAILIAMLAGYNWEWAQGVLSRTVEILTGQTSEGSS